ncbi:DNA-binding NarL/FixJ family response regulator [Aquimarina sp. EL_43]|uniref:response regulator n=1 Tax=unclassified Aquimarina TaxID=2627091 RepID=UPI0018C9FD3E|nr:MULTISPECIES: response regulator transcription factor [unclassified Aquimarina]MBG6132199.1 DNA-binding NarL/FixJ family response regulator [Aquimarina sp. EL_35]MBG6152996.1 DNA-binding NarL/FixJ family response regulator [Aquimarina sp. EL_32]MBG6171003.1 DNA-binding NarL/FixJ family response regulator [Aquimarina sp. EL_43]
MVRIVLVDDHFLVRDGIRALLEDEEQYEVVGEASDGIEAIELVQSLQPDIVICDIRMPEISGIETVQKLTSLGVSSKAIMLSMHDSDEYILQSINAGAEGYLLKGASKDEFLKALSVVSKGEKYFSGDVSSILIKKIKGGDNISSDYTSLSKDTISIKSKITTQNPFDLTKRENQILRLAISGKTNKDIAETLDISKRTTEVHRFNLMKKMKVKNILELSNKAKKYGMID